MKFHPNYIEALKEHYKDQEYIGSDWEKADKRNYHRFDTYTQSWYKISSLPDNAEYINETEDDDWNDWWDEFNINDYKVWTGDDIGKKFKGTITSHSLEFDFRDESKLKDSEKAMLKKYRENSEFDDDKYDEWTLFEDSVGVDITDYNGFLEMNLELDNGKQILFFPILKFLDKDEYFVKEDGSILNYFALCYTQHKCLPNEGIYNGSDFISSTRCKDVLFLHPISGEWEKVSFEYDNYSSGLSWGKSSITYQNHVERIKKYGQK